MTTSDDVMHDSPAAGQPPAAGTVPGTASAEEQPDQALAEKHSETAVDVPRAMISVKKLAAHPGNVRRDLDLSEEFIESVRANGVLVALRITPDGDNYPRHRRRPPPGRPRSRPGWTRCPMTWSPSGPGMRPASSST